MIDQVVDPENASRFSALLEIAMLVLLGVKERSREEFAALFAAADLSLCKVTPTPTPFRVITQPSQRIGRSRPTASWQPRRSEEKERHHTTLRPSAHEGAW